jgi:hypothetical protein
MAAPAPGAISCRTERRETSCEIGEPDPFADHHHFPRGPLVFIVGGCAARFLPICGPVVCYIIMFVWDGVTVTTEESVLTRTHQQLHDVASLDEGN